MAHLGTQLFLGKSDIKINEINERIFVDNSNIPFSIKPEYWIIFEYFYSLNKFSNTARGLLKLMQICLSTLKPEKTILLFFRWFDINTKNFSEGNDFIILINSWLKSSDIQHNMNNDLEISIGHCECVLVPIIKHLEENDIFKFTRDIINFSITNLRKTKGGIDLYKDNDNFEDILYWKNIIYKFGTGIIKFNDKVVIQGSKDHCTSMKDSFMFLLSSSLIIKKIVENDLTDCPFLDEIPICKANFRGIKDCISNPFYIDNPENKEEKCLFRNGVFLLGLQDRLKQNNQY
jgi:hypothetical protein